MRFEKRFISHARCEEINRMNIVCPWDKTVFKMNEEGCKYLTNEDESIIYGRAFMPYAQDRGATSPEIYRDYFFLVVNDEYFLHTLYTIDITEDESGDVMKVSERCELPDDEKINARDDKDTIIGLINFLNFHQFYHDPKMIAKQTLIYNGTEYSAEGVGEYVE